MKSHVLDAALYRFLMPARVRTWSRDCADMALTETAAQLKAGYGLPYVDSFAAATAGKTNILVTSDVKDFKKISWLQLLALPQHKS